MLEPIDNCCGCGACVAICPIHCIEMRENEEGFFYPKADMEKCLDCRMCERVCPEIDVRYYDKKDQCVEAYAAICDEEEIRQNSSSGGIFYPVAAKILEQGGIVFGAAMSEDGMFVQHIGVERLEELKTLMGAKYVQSAIGNVYEQVRQNLEQRRIVLFTGTPCQIAALHSYLGDNRKDDLFTMDFICHGVPSPGVWKRYLAETVGSASFVSFRDKTEGWKSFSLKVIDRNGKEIRQRENQNPYMRGFLNHLYCRYSCHNCKYKGIERNSELTLGDFWKVQSFLGDIDDDKGTSLVLVQNDRGKELITSLVGEEKIRIFQVDVTEAAKSNPMMTESITFNKKRSLFYRMIENKSICDSVEICLKRNLFERIEGKLRWILFRK